MLVSRRQTTIQVIFLCVVYESHCMWSVSYYTPQTVSGNAYVKCGLWKCSHAQLTRWGESVLYNFGEKAVRNILINIVLKFGETARQYGWVGELVVLVGVQPMITWYTLLSNPWEWKRRTDLLLSTKNISISDHWAKLIHFDSEK